MFVICPDCGADQQEVGKYCENCGRFITAADAAAASATPAGPAPWTAQATTPAAGPAAAAGPAPWDPPPAAAVPWTPPAAVAPSTPLAAGARFAVVRNGQANPADGFTITHAGEFLVGRPNQDAGTGVDVDLRQWVQPLDLGGQKQYLVHRNQCFLGLAPDGAVTIRPCPGAEGDTLIRPAGQPTFMPPAQLGLQRALRPDSTYPLQPGDQLYMGDPTAVHYFQAGDPTAAGTYLVLELLPR